MVPVLPGGVGRAEPVPWISSVIPGQASASVCAEGREGEGRERERKACRCECVDANSCTS